MQLGVLTPMFERPTRANPAATILGILGLCMACASAPAAASENPLVRPVQSIAEKLAFSNEGQVLETDQETLYISLGQQDGIPEGSRFEIVRLGTPLRIGDEILGYKETLIGKAEAYRVRKKLTLARLLESTEPPKKGDKVYQLKKHIKRVVVAQFQDGQGFNQLTLGVQRGLLTALSNKGMDVIERDQLERVLREQNLGYSGLVNLRSAKKIGKLLGAEAIVLGSVGDLGNEVTINARLVDLEAGNSLAATEIGVAKTPLIIRLRNTGVEESSPGGTSPKAGSQVKAAKQVLPFYENDVFRIEVLAVTREAGEVLLKMRYGNKLDREAHLVFDDPDDSYLIDGNGIQLVYKSHDGMGRRREMDIGPKFSRVGGLRYRDDPNILDEVGLSAKFGGTDTSGRCCRRFPVTIRGIQLP